MTAAAATGATAAAAAVAAAAAGDAVVDLPAGCRRWKRRAFPRRRNRFVASTKSSCFRASANCNGQKGETFVNASNLSIFISIHPHS